LAAYPAAALVEPRQCGKTTLTKPLGGSGDERREGPAAPERSRDFVLKKAFNLTLGLYHLPCEQQQRIRPSSSSHMFQFA